MKTFHSQSLVKLRVFMILLKKNLGKKILFDAKNHRHFQ